MLLENKAAIITGGASGIGRAISVRCAAEGARVCIADLDEAGGQETVSIIKERNGDAIFVEGNVSIHEDAKHIVEATVKEFGGLHILVNNAAVFIFASVLEASPEDFDRSMAVNVRGQALMAKYAIPEMGKLGGGSVVNIASISGLVGAAGSAPYSASKAAIIGLTRAMAYDAAPHNVRVNALCPGFVFTSALEKELARKGMTREKAEERHGEALLIKRFATPEEMANVAVFLTSDQASYMTGSCIVVDGGFTA